MDRAALVKEIALLLNRLVLASSAKGAQRYNGTAPDDWMTDADIDAIEAKVMAVLSLLTAEPERPQDTLLDAFKAGFSVAQHETDKYGEYHGESVEDEFRAWAAMGAEPERRAPEGR